MQEAVDKSIQVTSEPSGNSRAAHGNSADPAPEAQSPATSEKSSGKHTGPPALPIATHRFAFRQPSLRMHRDCGYVAELAMAVQRSVTTNCDVVLEK